MATVRQGPPMAEHKEQTAQGESAGNQQLVLLVLWHFSNVKIMDVTAVKKMIKKIHEENLRDRQVKF